MIVLPELNEIGEDSMLSCEDNIKRNLEVAKLNFTNAGKWSALSFFFLSFPSRSVTIYKNTTDSL